jgi:DNA-binding CsgD family transcriptional regulator
VAAGEVASAVISIASRRRMGAGEAVGGRVSSPQFVGRAEQLGLLSAAFELAARGRSTTVLIGGDAGVGKTRLVEEFSSKARSEGALVATGVCVPTDSGGLPYAPAVGILRDLHGQLSQLGRLDEPTTAEALGLVARGLGINSINSLDASGAAVPGDEFAKTRLFESVLTLATLLARTSPVVFVFEDLHWADSASAELLGYLVRNLTDTKALLLVTYRADEVMRDHPLHGWLTELGRHPRTAQLRLSGLDRAETATLIGGILGQQPTWALVDAVWARSQGNPFFAEELTAARDDASLSPELQGVILSRVESLSKEAQLALRVVAAAGTTVAHRLLAALGVLDADVLDRALAEAVDKQILVVDLSAAGYRFRHALLREAVYTTMLPGEVARLHRLLATTLTADPTLGAPGPGHRVAELAGHWWAAGDWPQALDASIAAAEATAAVGAFAEALAHAEHAATARERVASSPITHHELLARASEIAHLASAGGRAAELVQAAINSAGNDVDDLTAARYYALLGRHEWGRGQSQPAFDAYRKAVSLLPADPPTVELARILGGEASLLMVSSRHHEGEARAREAIAMARAVGARDIEGYSLNTLGCCLSGLGYADEGIDLLRQSIAIAIEVGSPDLLDRGYNNLCYALVEWGQYEEATTLLDESLAAGERMGFPRVNGVSDNTVGALVSLGRYDEAEARIAETGPRGVGICGVAPQLTPAEIAILRGQLDYAAELLAEVDKASAQVADVQTRGAFHMKAAALDLERGRADDAFAHVELALATTEGTSEASFAPDMCALGVRALADGLADARARGRQVEDADDRAAELVNRASQIVASHSTDGRRPPPRAIRAAAMCVAEQSRLSGSDPSLWAEAAQLWEASGEPYEAAYCRWRQAEALLERRAGRREATDCLQAAWQTASRIGAHPLRARIEQLAQRARISLREVDLREPVSTVADDLGLTPRELEILGQLADGLTDREIAEALFISKKTASVHVSNVLHKLDVTNRVEAGRVGQAHGLGARSTATHAVSG